MPPKQIYFNIKLDTFGSTCDCCCLSQWFGYIKLWPSPPPNFTHFSHNFPNYLRGTYGSLLQVHWSLSRRAWHISRTFRAAHRLQLIVLRARTANHPTVMVRPRVFDDDSLASFPSWWTVRAAPVGHRVQEGTLNRYIPLPEPDFNSRDILAGRKCCK